MADKTNEKDGPELSEHDKWAIQEDAAVLSELAVKLLPYFLATTKVTAGVDPTVVERNAILSSLRLASRLRVTAQGFTEFTFKTNKKKEIENQSEQIVSGEANAGPDTDAGGSDLPGEGSQ